MKRNRRALAIMLISAMIFTFMPSAVSAESNAQAPESRCLPGGTFDLVTLDDIAGGQPVVKKPGTKKVFKSSTDSSQKTMPLLMIVVGFKDTPYNESYDWGSLMFSSSKGSYTLANYYSDNSQGKFTFAPALENSAYGSAGNTNKADKVNDGIVHVTVSIDHDDWVDVWREGGHNRGTWSQAIGEAVSAADKSVNFGQYDSNGNGEIETNEMALGFIIAGGEGSESSNRYETDPKYLMWAHAWEMADFMKAKPVCDNKKLNKYIAIAEDLSYYRYTEYQYDHDYEMEGSDGFTDFSNDWASSAPVIAAGEEKQVDAASGEVVFKFTAPKNGSYLFYSENVEGGSIDTVGKVVGSDGTALVYSDDASGLTANQFGASFEAEAGKTYYLQARSYYDSETEQSYIVGISEIEADGTERIYAEQAGIATFAHELGHYLGLPDYYDVDSDDSGAWGQYSVERASIMAGGNWCYLYDAENDITTYRPCAFDACSRVKLGWVDPVVATAGKTYAVHSQNYSENPANSEYNVLKVPTTNSGEYYLIENRQFSGWDEALKTSYPEEDETYTYEDEETGETKTDIESYGSYAKTGGLMIWHVDEGILKQYWDDNEINTTKHRPGIMPTYMEYDNYPEFKFIAGNVDTSKLFFDGDIYSSRYAATAGEKMILPVYSKSDDRPAARTGNRYSLTLAKTGSGIDVTVTDENPSAPDPVNPPEPEPVTPETNPQDQMGKDGTATGAGAHIAAAEKAITTMKSDKDLPGTVFRKLMLKSTKQTKTTIKLNWKKVSGAKKYVIYGNKCGSSKKPKKLATVKGTTVSKTIKKISGKKLKKGTYYKFIIVAVDKNSKVLSTSKLIHVVTKGGKSGNHKSVTVSKTVIKKAKKLKKGKSLKLKAKAVLQKKSLKAKKHVGLRYESSNKKIATVSKTGKIRGKKKGTCYVYAYAQNGVCKKIKVIVK